MGQTLILFAVLPWACFAALCDFSFTTFIIPLLGLMTSSLPLVSLGRWDDWIQTVIPYVRGLSILEIGHGPGHLQIKLMGEKPVCGRPG